jgi:phosphatidylglycerophosphate synthase
MQQERTSPGLLWRNVPNAISTARLCATSVLLASAVLRRAELFKWLLLACLLSDFLDGWIARTFHLSSKLGASLDSIADVLTLSIAAFGLWIFQRAFVSAHYGGLLLVVGFFVAELMAALWRYGRPSSFHTLLAHVASYMNGFFLISIFFWGYLGWVYYPTVIVCVAELAEEMALVFLLPEWRTDVGGIYRVLTRRLENS